MALGGEVYRLSPPSGTESILHSFTGGVAGASDDGGYPIGGITIDAAGALYGTAFNAGRNAAGAIFKLTPNADGTGWHETPVSSFMGRDGDGADPAAGVTIGRNGVIYGTTEFGGFFKPEQFRRHLLAERRPAGAA
jgi:hypothetical protein